ncbi:cytochrome c3 family protein [Neobacillus sp. WH10]|uniref:cytochrome c3 family protein n=1 Tax=Neobacillus sp. WH10 TaxID=3047873 RepID=UPI0024C12C5A|nr:cytochrome c3 family protein [Neobacillus sp. WH10]WHY76896.1 cytochrome c3 family protein [Neobacillus sp. WH10]
MSKVKLSFSLFFALFLVGMMSTAAFAKDAYGVKAVPVGDGTVKVDFNGDTSDTASVTVFTINLLDDKDALVETKDITIDGSKKGSYTTPILTTGKIYTVELTRQAEPTKVVSGATIVITDASNKLLDVSIVKPGTSKVNANETGFNVLKKNKSGHKTHGSYQANTNSCASCHQTHTAEGDYLLFKDGTYSTCAACHDGTMGAKGVFGAPTNAGTFGGTHEGNMSIHLADGSVAVSAAPGGNRNLDGDNDRAWTAEFTCASCHEPHGSQGSKLLKGNPLGLGGLTKGTAAGQDPNGKRFLGVKVYDAVPGAKAEDVILVKYTVTATDIGADLKKAKSPYVNANLIAGDVVLQTYSWNPGGNYGAGAYRADYSLLLQEKGYPYKSNTVFKDATNTDITSQLDIKWLDGFITDKGTKKIADIASADLSLGIAVTITPEHRSLYDNTYPGYVSDSGVQMSNFCTSCHADYLSGTYAKADTGVYSTAHRHQTNTDMLTCSRCHYAHGTDATIMKDANDQGVADLIKVGGKFDPAKYGGDSAAATAAATEYLKDPNPSSALKKYTGMSVCYACHGSGAAFMNDGKSERLLGGQPGTPRN